MKYATTIPYKKKMVNLGAVALYRFLKFLAIFSMMIIF